MDWNEGYVVETEYTADFYRDLTPRLLQFATLVQSIEPPALEASFNYMELGCGQGVSTNLIAACNPQGTFYANDFNPTHIRNARALARDAGTQNLTFLENSFKELLDMDLPEFDVIAMHGVYSWVSHQNKMEITDFIKRKLKSGGLVYVSYNCLPGWSSFAPVRRVMAEYATYAPQAPGGPPGVLRGAVDLLGKMKEIGARFFTENPAAARRLDTIREHPPNYLVHEYLNREWSLHYHADVVRTMEEARLSYVGSSSVMDNVVEFALTDKARELCNSITDRVLRETIIDFFRNRNFRRDVFVRGVSRLGPQNMLERLKQVRFALLVPRKECKLEVRVPIGTVTFPEKLWVPIWDALESGPRTLNELLAIPEISFMGLQAASTSLVHMAAVGYVFPCCPSQAVEDTLRPGTDRFNNAILDRALAGNPVSWLASPVLGTGLFVRLPDLLLLAFIRQGGSDVAEQAWQWMRSRGMRVVVQGKPCETDEANLAELRQQADRFADTVLPTLQRLGVMPQVPVA